VLREGVQITRTTTGGGLLLCSIVRALRQIQAELRMLERSPNVHRHNFSLLLFLEEWVHNFQQQSLDPGGSFRNLRIDPQRPVQIDPVIDDVVGPVQACLGPRHAE